MSEVIQVSDTMSTIGLRVRVEKGPVLKSAIANDETLSDDVTAPHYALGKRDKMGKIIQLGEVFHYLDYKGEKVWHVYALESEDEPVEGDPGATELITRFHRRGFYATRELAEAAALTLSETLPPLADGVDAADYQ